MNKFFGLTALGILFTLGMCNLYLPIADAAIQGAPFSPEEDARFNCLETGYCKGSSYTPPGFSPMPFSNLAQGYAAFGQFLKTIWKADINAVQAAGSTNTVIILPANTIIQQAWVYFKTAITPAGTLSRFSCAANVGDILGSGSGTDLTGQGVNSILAASQTGTAATMTYTAAGCTVAFASSVHTGTAGEMTLFVETVPAQ